MTIETRYEALNYLRKTIRELREIARGYPGEGRLEHRIVILPRSATASAKVKDMLFSEGIVWSSLGATVNFTDRDLVISPYKYETKSQRTVVIDIANLYFTDRDLDARLAENKGTSGITYVESGIVDALPWSNNHNMPQGAEL